MSDHDDGLLPPRGYVVTPSTSEGDPPIALWEDGDGLAVALCDPATRRLASVLGARYASRWLADEALEAEDLEGLLVGVSERLLEVDPRDAQCAAAVVRVREGWLEAACVGHIAATVVRRNGLRDGVDGDARHRLGSLAMPLVRRLEPWFVQPGDRLRIEAGELSVTVTWEG